MKKAVKKWSLLFLALSLMLIAFAGCSKKESASSEGKEEAKDDLPWDKKENGYKIEQDLLDGKGSLKFWTDNDDYAAAIIEAWNKKYPDVEIEYEKVGSVDARAKMALDGEAGLGADVFIQPHDGIGPSLADSIIGPMGRYDEQLKGRIIESALGTVENEGQYYGVPISTESIALFYNKTLLKKLTGSDEPAKDWNQIIELSKTYNDKAKNQWTIRWESGNSYTNHFFLTAAGFNLFGKEGKDAKKLDFESEKVTEGLEFFKSVRPVWDVNAEDATNDTTTLEFVKGKTPYLINGPWAIADANKGAKENGFEYGITTIPTINGETPKTFSGNQIANVSSYSKYPGAARVFAMFLASEEGAEVLYKTTGKLPALNAKAADKVDGLGEDELLKGVAKQAANSVPMPSIPEMASYWDPAKAMYVNVWNGLLEVEAAQKKATEDYQALLQSAGK
ncbi:arabinogalactan oligomer/maltooligosaccharide transport system substrate-binding protein [Peribacillus deserti]|uniref:Maltodextrin-binding protein n=1 Tax=Peribacillus deserti TaxID=673318 RepID=A0ABS2QJT9_9BACI|nr:maltose ABC transporter substrate-binding protein [Peribacillus deserti]MBM7693438.1 arabinogalactan oligomer/maltooligosaccharide transport system substrate-binding protein [Peribacillus deserti]